MYTRARETFIMDIAAKRINKKTITTISFFS